MPLSLPDLPPDFAFPALTLSAADSDFAFEVKRAALGLYIEEKWGWDEAFQRKMHADRYSAVAAYAITYQDQRIGTIGFTQKDDHARIGEFYILPSFQNLGLGSRILQHCIDQTNAAGLDLRLEYLKWNPVGALYRRFGFVDTHETDTHYHLIRKAD